MSGFALDLGSSSECEKPASASKFSCFFEAEQFEEHNVPLNEALRSMKAIFASIIVFGLAPLLLGHASALRQQSTGAQATMVWHDPSPHKVLFVAVDKDVRLEVLDWGGSGRPVVLLAGLGDTAHIFDSFAPKLTAKYHVYGITRRGFGNSSHPDSGYSADRLGDDVIAVLDFLKLQHPVLVGHSIAGEELSSIGARFPERVAGLIYLDAASPFAFYDPVRGDFQIDLNDLQKKLELLQTKQDKADIQDLLQTDLPRFERDLQGQLDYLNLVSIVPPSFFAGPTAADRASFSAFQKYMLIHDGVLFPEAELREMYEAKPDGSAGPSRIKPNVVKAIEAGEQKFTDVHVPILAIYAIPKDHGVAFSHLDSAIRTKIEDTETALNNAEIEAFEKNNPSARVVRLPHANHGVFLSNEADVLQAMNSFISSLPQ